MITAYKDTDGDVWTRTADGLYAYAGFRPRTAEALAEEYGPLSVESTSEDLSREDALDKAVEVLNRLAPPTAGVFGAAAAPARAAAAELLARFLMGEPAADQDDYRDAGV